MAKIKLKLSTGDIVFTSPAHLADHLYLHEQERLKLGKKLKAMESDQSVLEKWVIDNLPKSQTSGLQGSVGAIRITQKPKFIIENAAEGGWDKLYAWIKKHDAFHLLQRRLNEKAIDEETIELRKRSRKPDAMLPGVGVFTATSVSITKAK